MKIIFVRYQFSYTVPEGKKNVLKGSWKVLKMPLKILEKSWKISVLCEPCIGVTGKAIHTPCPEKSNPLDIVQ